MSKIGKISISIPEKVKVALAGSIINIEGPLGKKSLNIDLETFDLDIKGTELSKDISKNEEWRSSKDTQVNVPQEEMIKTIKSILSKSS